MTIDPKMGNIYPLTAEFGPALATTPENPRQRPPMIKDSFVVLVVEK
jgi:hypothetical protein